MISSSELKNILLFFSPLYVAIGFKADYVLYPFFFQMPAIRVKVTRTVHQQIVAQT